MDTKGSIYEYAARSVLCEFANFVDGTPNDTFAVISSHQLESKPREAMRASAERLGYGHDSCAWIVTNYEPETDNPSEEISDSSLKTLIEGLDPIAIVTTDSSALKVLNTAYSKRLGLNDLGYFNGRKAVSLNDFTTMLESEESKQLAWYLLKNLKLNK